MSLPVFLELVEIKAKTASILPFLIGACFSYYYYGKMEWLSLFFYFISMVLFNMFVDIWDNYNDYRHAKDQDYKDKTNIIGRENLSIRQVEWLMILFLTTSASIGFILSWFLGWPLMLLGGFCYAVGIFYSAGPRPLSSLPLGEVFSGFTMGFIISLICVYINTSQSFLWNTQTLTGIFFISLPNTLWIANLMLANNLCDKEEDEKNQRYTLIHYIGIKKGLWLFAIANSLAFLAILYEFLLGFAPSSVLLTLFLIPFVYQQTRLLWRKQEKTETFVCAIRILALGSVTQVLTYVIGIIF